MSTEYEVVNIKKNKTNVKKQPRYNVVMLNDNVTTMDFVVEVLMEIFKHPLDEATELMLKIDSFGEAIVGTYSYEIASTKMMQTIQRARKENFPLALRLDKID